MSGAFNIYDLRVTLGRSPGLLKPLFFPLNNGNHNVLSVQRMAGDLACNALSTLSDNNQCSNVDD